MRVAEYRHRDLPKNAGQFLKGFTVPFRLQLATIRVEARNSSMTTARECRGLIHQQRVSGNVTCETPVL
jgi:hypothetical protein